jgi:hypothetical protein
LMISIAILFFMKGIEYFFVLLGTFLGRWDLVVISGREDRKDRGLAWKNVWGGSRRIKESFREIWMKQISGWTYSVLRLEIVIWILIDR